jgi:hypothetical protein
MSSKAPSFPSIYLKLHPVDWLQFYYLHGWLISRVHDSLASYSSQIAGRPRNIDRPKYIAMHALQINPWKNLAYTIGETITYSDWSPYWGYLMPFVFYRSVDHSFEGGTGENTGNNGSIFFDIKYFPAAKVKCFTTVFIDEMSVSDLLKGDNARNQIAYSIGSAIYNLLIPRLFVRAEYTRIQPWVYSNFVQTQTYTNANYLMGHYIGQNADQFYVRIDYAFLHNLNVSFSAERTRQGGFGAVQYQYDYIAEEFLYGLNRNETAFTLEARYEYTHDLTAEAFLRFTNIKDEDISRTPDWRRGSFTNFGLSLYYGL